MLHNPFSSFILDVVSFKGDKRHVITIAVTSDCCKAAVSRALVFHDYDFRLNFFLLVLLWSFNKARNC